MIEILREWALPFAAVALPILAGFIVHGLQKQRTELAFGVISARRLLTVSEELAKRVIVLFDSTPVTSINLVVMGLRNSGDKPIQITDFMHPLKVTFGPSGRVLSAEVMRQVPSNLGAQVTNQNTELYILPVLLNPGDYMVVQVLVTVPVLQVEAEARFIGFSDLWKLNTGTRLRRDATRYIIEEMIPVVIMMAAYGAVYWYFTRIDSTTPYRGEFNSAWWIGGAVISLFLLKHFWDWAVGRINNNSKRYIDEV